MWTLWNWHTANYRFFLLFIKYTHSIIHSTGGKTMSCPAVDHRAAGVFWHMLVQQHSHFRLMIRGACQFKWCLQFNWTELNRTLLSTVVDGCLWQTVCRHKTRHDRKPTEQAEKFTFYTKQKERKKKRTDTPYQCPSQRHLDQNVPYARDEWLLKYFC